MMAEATQLSLILLDAFGPSSVKQNPEGDIANSQCSGPTFKFVRDVKDLHSGEYHLFEDTSKASQTVQANSSQSRVTLFTLHRHLMTVLAPIDQGL